MIATPDSLETTIILVVRWVKLGVEIFGAGLVTLGVCLAIVHLIRTFPAGKPAEFTETRLILARYVALALEFELGGGHSRHGGFAELGSNRQARRDRGDPHGIELLPLD